VDGTPAPASADAAPHEPQLAATPPDAAVSGTSDPAAPGAHESGSAGPPAASR
jgi:hypothetical protein